MDAMVDAYLDGCEVVYGVRSSRETDTFFKRFTAQSFYKFLAMMGAEVVYNHADYRLISARVLKEFANFKEVNLFLRGLIPLVGFKSTSVSYSRAERIAGESHYPLKKMIALAVDGITSLSVKPLQFITGFIAWVITRFIFRFLEDRRDSMPIAELVLDFDIREVLPFDIPFIGAAPEKEPAPVKKAPLTVETIRNRRGPAFENRDADVDDYAEPESTPRRGAAPRGGSHAKAESASPQRFKLNLPSMPGAYKGKHEKK